MRTTLTIDDNLIEEVVSLTKKKNRSEAIREAIAGFINQKKREQLIALRGNVDILDNIEELREQEKMSK